MSVAWRNVLPNDADKTVLVGIEDDGTLLVLCRRGSDLARQLDARRDEALRNLNAQLDSSRRVTDLRFVEAEPETKLLVELMQAVRVEVQALSERVEQLCD